MKGWQHLSGRLSAGRFRSIGWWPRGASMCREGAETFSRCSDFCRKLSAGLFVRPPLNVTKGYE